jgi:hypothetical protein
MTEAFLARSNGRIKRRTRTQEVNTAYQPEMAAGDAAESAPFENIGVRPWMGRCKKDAHRLERNAVQIKKTG